MNMSVIFSAVIVIIIIYLIIWYFSSDSKTLASMQNGNQTKLISNSSLSSRNGSSNNYTYSIWFYVNDWNYRYGEEKVLFSRSSTDSNGNEEYYPKVSFNAMSNDISIQLSLYPTSSSSSVVTHTCTVRNFPLQKWVNLTISLYGRSLDVYLDGKLVRTCVLPGVAKINPDANVFLTPNGGFAGFTSKFEYYNTASNPQQAYNIYKAGYGGSVLGNLFNKYRIRISFLESNKESGGFEI